MELTYIKTNKLKPLNKIRKKFIENYTPTLFSSVDDYATHIQIQANQQIVGCVSYYFDEKIVVIYGICIEHEFKDKVIFEIKNQTKQFDCEYLIKN